MSFIVYSMDGCQHCELIKDLMLMAKQEHVIYTLGEDFNREGFYHQFGQGSTFPQVVINDLQHIGGCTETVKYLKENKLV